MTNKDLLQKVLGILKKEYLNFKYLNIKLRNNYINNFSGIINWLYWINESDTEIKNYLKDIFNILEEITNVNELTKFMFKHKLGYNNKKALTEILDIDKLNIRNYIDRIEQTKNISKKNLFNEFQKKAIKSIEDSNNLLISAPTSVGKSTLIRWYALQKFKEGKMVIFIVPTLSLVNEYFNFLNKEGVATNLSSTYIKNSINILTQERALNLFSNNMSLIDKNTVLIFDEFYTTMADSYSERSNFNWNLLISAKKQSAKSYFLLPYLKNSSIQIENRIDNFKVKELNSDNSLSTQLIFHYNEKDNLVYYNGKEGINLKINHENEWWKEILKTRKQSIIYISNSKIYSLNIDNINPHNLDNEYKKKIIINYVREFITEYDNFRIFEFIKMNCLIHNGNMETTLRRMIEKSFREGDFINIFCSSTITYGVNLNCERLIILNSRTNGNKADYLNLANLVGRVGRVGSKIVGEVFTSIKSVFNKFNKFQPDSIFNKNIKTNEIELKNIIEKVKQNKEKNMENWNKIVFNIKSKKNNVKFSRELSDSLDSIENKVIDPEGNIKKNYKEYNLIDFVNPIIKVKEFKDLILDNLELYKNYLINIKVDDKNRDNIFDLFKNYYYVSNDNDFFLNRIRLVFDDFIFNKSIKIGYMNYLNSVTSSNETYYISDVYHSISNRRFFNEDEQFDYSNKTHMNKFIDFYILNRNNILEKYIKPFFNNITSLVFNEASNKIDEIIYNEELEEEDENKDIKREILSVLNSMDINRNFISKIIGNLDYNELNYDYSIKNIIKCLKIKKYQEYLEMVI